jgi:predicted dehydrogenase
MREIGILIVGSGKIALANHLPGVAMSGRAKVVALCDSNAATLDEASKQTGITRTYADWQQALKDPLVDAVIIATPNVFHPPIVIAAAAAKKHVLCEKPLALELKSAVEMYQAVEKAGVKHMTAFTYRFVPAMRYTAHLIKEGKIGRPFHFRAQRFQDWEEKDLGWRMVKKLAGTGEIGDMLSHRIDYSHMMIGPMKRVVCDLRTFTPMRSGKPNDTDDWVAMLAEYDREVTGVLESTKLATGRGEGYGGRDDVEVNGSEGTIVASTQSPNEIRVGRKGTSELEVVKLPKEFLVYPGSPRDPAVGDPRVAFRYDQAWEFIDAIVNNHICHPSLKEGVMMQTVVDAALRSHQEKRWIDVNYPV